MDHEVQSLKAQIIPLDKAHDALQQALVCATTSRTLLGDVSLGTLSASLDMLGAEPVISLRNLRTQLSKDIEAARTGTFEASRLYAISNERATNLRSTFEAAVVVRDTALAAFPEVLDAAIAAGQSDLAEAVAQKREVAADLASLENTIASRKRGSTTR
jgi:hypothetical protein